MYGLGEVSGHPWSNLKPGWKAKGKEDIVRLLSGMARNLFFLDGDIHDMTSRVIV